MGGGGFMQHASDTNRKDRSQKAARRETFNGNHSDKTLLGHNQSTKLDFSHLSQEQIDQERLRIKRLSAKRRKARIITYSIALTILTIGFFWLYYKMINLG